jgi:hypothetical protein
MFGKIYGLGPQVQVPQALRAHPAYPLLSHQPWPASYEPVTDGLPRLFIGREATQLLVGRHLAPLETRLDEHTWWAFSPQEDVTYFIRQLEAFLRAVPPALLTSVSWCGLDPLVRGPYTATELWPRLLPTQAGKWTVLEHDKGWNWWDPATPGQVQGLLADAYYAHCGVPRAELREWLQRGAAYYVRDSREHPVILWFENRFGYSKSDALRVAPWLMHLKHQAGYLLDPQVVT